MIYFTRTIGISAAGNGIGASFKLDGYRAVHAEITGTFVADLGFQVSHDEGTTWREIASVAAPGGEAIPDAATHLRVETSGYVSGTPAVLLRVSW